MPVNTMSWSRGRSSVTFLRSCSRAPWMTSRSVPTTPIVEAGSDGQVSGALGRAAGWEYRGHRVARRGGRARKAQPTTEVRPMELRPSDLVDRIGKIKQLD